MGENVIDYTTLVKFFFVCVYLLVADDLDSLTRAMGERGWLSTR